MIYDGVLEVSYKHAEGLTSITEKYPDIKVSLWCNWSIDIIAVDSDNLNEKNNFIENLETYIGKNMILAASSESSPIIIRPCNCPSSPVSVILPEYDSFHISPIVYEKNKEILHVMLASSSTDSLFDKIKELEYVEQVNLKYLTPYKFPEKPFPIYVPINDLLANLTDKQYEILLEAFNKGYYELPRQSTTEELSKKFDISRRAFEDHLRKAERNVFNIIVPYFLMNRLEKIDD